MLTLLHTSNTSTIIMLTLLHTSNTSTTNNVTTGSGTRSKNTITIDTLFIYWNNRPNISSTVPLCIQQLYRILLLQLPLSSWTLSSSSSSVSAATTTSTSAISYNTNVIQIESTKLSMGGTGPATHTNDEDNNNKEEEYENNDAIVIGDTNNSTNKSCFLFFLSYYPLLLLLYYIGVVCRNHLRQVFLFSLLVTLYLVLLLFTFVYSVGYVFEYKKMKHNHIRKEKQFWVTNSLTM
jgi:hypothetical protein